MAIEIGADNDEIQRIVPGLTSLREACDDLGVEFLVIGALARDLLLQHLNDIDVPRRTRDIDVAAAVDDWESYGALRNRLINALAAGSHLYLGGDKRQRFSERLVVLSHLPLRTMAMTGLPVTTGLSPLLAKTFPPQHTPRLGGTGHTREAQTQRESSWSSSRWARGPETPHRYYRAIVRELGGEVSPCAVHARIACGTKSVEDPSTGSEPPFWIRRDVGLKNALREVNGFVPKHQRPDTHAARQFLKGRKKCLALWHSVLDTDH